MLAAGTAAAQSLPERPIPFERLRGAFAPVSVIVVGDRACHRLDTLLADTSARRSRGLMFVEEMPADAGMLFVYPRDATLSIWMKNTLIPLDIAFFTPDGAVVDRFEMEPCITESCPTYRPSGAYRFALEMPAGSMPIGIELLER